MKYPLMEIFGEAKEEKRLDMRFASIYDPIGPDQDPYRPDMNPFLWTPDLDPGFYDMSFTSYIHYPLPDYSFYKAFGDSPAHGLAWTKESKIIGATKQKNLDFGSALHWLVLEPEKFEERVIIDPGVNKNRKDYREWRSRVQDNAIILTEDQIKTAMHMRDRLYRKPSIKRLLEEPGRCELTGIFQDPEYGLFHKIRIDKLLTDVPVLVDYKTSTSASSFGFSKIKYNFKYPWQAALYLCGVSALTGYRYEKWIWIVQEKEPPYECRSFVADLSEIYEAMDRIYMHIERLAECMRDNHWPGYIDTDLSEVFQAWAPELEDDLLPF